MHVGQTEIAALEFVGQAFVVDAEQVQYRGLEVVDVDGVDGRVVGEVVGFAETEAGFDAAAGQPDGEDVGVMVSAERFLVVDVSLAERSAAGGTLWVRRPR